VAFGGRDLTACEILDLDISDQDKLHITLGIGELTDREVQEISFRFAERVLPEFESPMGDDTLRKCLRTAREYLEGDIVIGVLDKETRALEKRADDLQGEIAEGGGDDIRKEIIHSCMWAVIWAMYAWNVEAGPQSMYACNASHSACWVKSWHADDDEFERLFGEEEKVHVQIVREYLHWREAKVG